MILAWDKLAAVGLAIGLHVAVMGDLSRDGADNGGAGGDSVVSIRASSAQIETMVADWTRPPDALPTTSVLQRPPATETAQPQAPRVLPKPDAPRAAVPLAAITPPQSAAPTAVPRALPRPRSNPAQATPGPVAPSETVAPDPPSQPETDVAARTPQRPAMPQAAPSDVPPRKAEAPPPKVKPKARPARKAQAAASGQTARKAAGTARSEQAGTGTEKAASATKGQQQRALSAWGGKIAQRIARRARASGRSGEVRIAIAVARNGRVQQVRVVRSSGDAALDRDALRAVRSAGRMPPAPEALTEPSYSFSFALVLTR